MYFTKKYLKTIGKERLIKLIKHFEFYIQTEERYFSKPAYKLIGRSPDFIDITKQEMENRMMNNVITADQYKGCLIALKLIEEILDKIYKEKVKRNTEVLKKLKIDYIKEEVWKILPKKEE